MRAIVTVIGKDQVGIIASVCALLAEHNVNVLDISQTILQDYFTMIMLVELSDQGAQFAKVRERLMALAETMRMEIRMQHSDIFDAMHRV